MTLLADPSGPPDTRPPGHPPAPPAPPSPSYDLADEMLRGIDNHLLGLLGVAVSLPDSEDRMEICGQEVLKHRLRMARKAIADLRAYNSGRDGNAAAPSASRPDRAGGPPAPGADFHLPNVRRQPEFQVGVARVYPSH